jgi:hypothetical protein
MSDKLTWVPVSLNTPELVDLNQSRITAEGVAAERRKVFVEKATAHLASKGVTAPAGTRLVFSFNYGVAIAFAPIAKGGKGGKSSIEL